MIGLPYTDRNLVYEAWNKGRVDLRPINHARIRYTLDYIDKQVFGANALFEQYGDFEPPFCHFSKGLGVDYIIQNISDFNEFGELEYTDTKKYILPPYYRDKFNFKKKPQQIIDYEPYSESVIKYAKERNISLPAAQIERAKLKEQSIIKNEIIKGIGKHDLSKNELIIASSKIIQKY